MYNKQEIMQSLFDDIKVQKISKLSAKHKNSNFRQETHQSNRPSLLFVCFFFAFRSIIKTSRYVIARTALNYTFLFDEQKPNASTVKNALYTDINFTSNHEATIIN